MNSKYDPDSIALKLQGHTDDQGRLAEYALHSLGVPGNVKFGQTFDAIGALMS